MKKALSEAYQEAKKLPKGLWLAAVIVPGGLVTITVYLAGKSIYDSKMKKGNQDDRSKDSQG
jgi:hypothetical protein